MFDTMRPGWVIGGGGWVRTAARVLGVGILSFLANGVIVWMYFGFIIDEEHSPVWQWLVIPVAILIGPAYGWMECRAARQRNQNSPARAAKIAAIFVLMINGVILALFWLLYEAFKQGRVR